MPTTLYTQPPRRLRRNSVRAFLATLATAIVALGPAASGAGAAAVPAVPADSFVDSIGINTHTYYSDKNYYSRFNEWKLKLDNLGVRHIRENLVTGRPDQYQRLRELAALGARPTLILGDPNGRDGRLPELISIVKTQLNGVVAAVEGTNEFDLWGGSDWLPRVRDYQEDLYAAVKSDPALSGLPVIGPSIVHHKNQSALGDISRHLDYGNIHSYPDGYEPEDNLDRHLGYAARNSAGKTVMATESGYHTAVGWTGDHKPTSEAVAAVYLPRMYLEYFRRGIARTFAYELLDQAAGAQNREDTFGLLRHDLSPKPSFVALRNLIALLEDRGPGFSAGSLDYSLAGETDDVNSLLLQKRDGSFYLALWRTSRIWDPVARLPLPDRLRPLRVDFDHPAAGATLYRPSSSPNPISPASVDESSMTVNLGAEPVVIKLGRTAPGGRISLQLSRRSVPAGGQVAVSGRLPQHASGTPTRIAIQHWRGKSWRTVGYGRTRKNGSFRRGLRLSRARFGRLPRLRAIASVAKPSRAVRVRIRKRGGAQPKPRAAIAAARAVGSA